MAALTEALQHQAEQNPTASYYNLVLLRYQVRLSKGQSEGGPHKLCKYRKCLAPSAGHAWYCVWSCLDQVGVGGTAAA